ncbi:hypothetical protein COLO4_09271 [Corchorus olitorius]|uniref:Uncharacterized protein n=1 Tax=Corchorus olitorius TaxID=93759 RepID=A0A1R3KCK8_9ROSI|nr:hypothetical protein COLO4_09271 [Corchorus olitorius]
MLKSPYPMEQVSIRDMISLLLVGILRQIQLLLGIPNMDRQNPSPSLSHAASLLAISHPPNSNLTIAAVQSDAASVPAVSHPLESDLANNSQPMTTQGVLNLGDDVVKVDVNGERRLAKITLGKLWNEIPPHRVVVEGNEFGQPIGNEAKLLGGYLGKLARQYTTLPVIPDSWHKLRMDRKTVAMDLVKVFT